MLPETCMLWEAVNHVEKAAFVIDLPDLRGSKKLAAQSVGVHCLMEFEGD